MRTSYSVPALCCCEDCVHAKLWHELEISCSLFNAVSNLCWLGDEQEGSWVSEMVPGALFCWALTFAAVEPHKMQGSLSGHVGALAAFLHWWIKARLPAVNVDKLKKKKKKVRLCAVILGLLSPAATFCLFAGNLCTGKRLCLREQAMCYFWHSQRWLMQSQRRASLPGTEMSTKMFCITGPWLAFV